MTVGLLVYLTYALSNPSSSEGTAAITVTGSDPNLLYCLIIVALTPLLGAYIMRVFSGERTFLSPILRPVELTIYKLAGVNESSEQHAVSSRSACCCFMRAAC